MYFINSVSFSNVKWVFPPPFDIAIPLKFSEITFRHDHFCLSETIKYSH